MSFRMQSPNPWPWILWIIRPNEMPSSTEAFKVRSRGGLKHQITLKARISSLTPCRTWDKRGTKECHNPSPVQWAGNLRQAVGRQCKWKTVTKLLHCLWSSQFCSRPLGMCFSFLFFSNTETVQKKEFIFHSIGKEENLVPFKWVLQPQFIVLVPPILLLLFNLQQLVQRSIWIICSWGVVLDLGLPSLRKAWESAYLISWANASVSLG